MTDSSQGFSSPRYGTATFTNTNGSDSDRSSSDGDDPPYQPFFGDTYAGRILSMITERTEPTTSRPPSGVPRPESSIPEILRRSTHLGGTPSPSQHIRSSTDPASDRAPSQGRRAGQLIAFFEDKNADAGGGHSRIASAPGGPRSPSPYLPPASQSTPNIGSSYGTGPGFTSLGFSRSSSPTKRHSGSSGSSASSASLPISTLVSPPLRGLTSMTATDTWSDTRTRTGGTYQSPGTFTGTFSDTFSNTFTPSNTFTGTAPVTVTPTTSPLRRPQTSPRSPLTSVRNIVAAWKERTPATKSSPKSSAPESVTTASSPPVVPGHLGLRRQPARIGARSRDQPSALEDAPFDVTDLTPYTKGNAKPDRIGLLWYLNVHAPPPYRWQRCQALLYPHMLLLSWIAPGGGRGVVSLDLLNCTSVISVPSPTHPNAQDDVGTIAARLQSAERGGQPLMDMLVPFHLLYGDGIERVAAESLLERQRWVNYLWDTIHRPMIDRSETRSPTGSIGTIQSVETRSSVGSSTGSASTVFVPPFDTIPEMSDIHSLVSGSRVSRQASLISSHHAGTVDDTAILNQQYVYPGDRRVIPPSRHGSLRRTTSMTNLDEAFASSTRDLPKSHGLIDRSRLEGSPVPGSSESSLGANLRVLPGRGSEKSMSHPSSSDKEFFSAGSGTISADTRSSFHSTTSFTGIDGTTLTGLGITSSGLDTRIISSTLSPRWTESASMLGDTSTFTSASSLSTPRDHRRSTRSSSRTLSSYDSYCDDSPDKENSESYTPSGTPSYTSSRTRSEMSRCQLSHSSEFSSLTFPCSSVSGSTTSCISTPSTETIEKGESEVYITPSVSSSTYQTARTPSTTYESLPTIPSESEFDTAEVCSTEYVTVDICPSERSTEYSTAEICSTQPENIPLPLSSPSVTTSAMISSPSTIPTMSDFDIDIIPPIDPALISLPPSTVEVSEEITPTSVSSVSVHSPTVSIVGPSLSSAITATPTAPPRTTLTSVTESDLDLTPSAPSPRPPPSPSVHPSLWAPETNESYESSILRASPSVGSLALPEGPDTSFETSFLRPSGTPMTSMDRLTPIYETPTTPSHTISKSPSPLGELPRTMSTPSVSVPTWEPTVSTVSSLSRTISSVSGVSSVSMRSSALDARSLLDVPFITEPSTEPSLLSTHRGSTPQRLSSPSAIPLPSSPFPSAPSVSMSVSISTPQTNIPSVHTILDTIPSDEGRSEILTHDINRLLQYIHDLDQVRGQESHEMADNVRAIRDELYDLSDHLHRPTGPRLDRSAGGSIVAADQPVAPRPVLLTPPPFRVPSPGSIMSSESFLSSHHSDDDILMQAGRDWSERMSSSPPLPPLSGTPPSPSPSTASGLTARPRESLADLRDLLDRIKDQVSGLWDGQVSTNHMLDDIRGRLPAQQELQDRLRRIEDLMQRILDQGPRPISEVTESTEPSSGYTAELDRILQRFRDAAGRRDIPIAPVPQPARPGLSLDDELASLLRAPIPPAPREVQPPPPLKYFEYHPAARATRPRSASPTLPPLRPGTVPTRAPVQFDERDPPRRIRRPDSEITYVPVIPRPPEERQMHDVGRRPPVPPVVPVIPSDLHRPPTAPADLGRDPQQGPGRSWYHPGQVPVPPPGTFVPQPGQPAPGAAPTFIPMPPGPTIVQVPLFDTLMDILRENRLAQLATVEQQRELMRYMTGLNDWLEMDVRDRQAELRGVSARIDQLRHDIGRLGIPMQPLDARPPFVVPPVPQVATIGPQPAFELPLGFVQQPPVVPPVIPQFHPSVVPPVIPMPMHDVGRPRAPSPPAVPVIPDFGRTSRVGEPPVMYHPMGPGPGRASPPDRPPYVPSLSPPPSDVMLVPPPQAQQPPIIITHPPAGAHPPTFVQVPGSRSSTESSRESSPSRPYVVRPSVLETAPSVAHDPTRIQRMPSSRTPLPSVIPAIPFTESHRPDVQPGPTIVIQQPPTQIPVMPPPGVMPPFGIPVSQPPYTIQPSVGPQPQIIHLTSDRSPRRSRSPVRESDRRRRDRSRSPVRESDRRRRDRSRSPVRESDRRRRDRSPRRSRSRSSSPRRGYRRERYYSRSRSYSPGRPPIIMTEGRRSPVIIARSPSPRSRRRRSPRRDYSPTRPYPITAPPVTVIAPETRRSRSPPPMIIARSSSPGRSRRRDRSHSRTPPGPVIIQPTPAPAPSRRRSRSPRRSRSRSPAVMIPGLTHTYASRRSHSPPLIIGRPRTSPPHHYPTETYAERSPRRRYPSYRSRSYSPRRDHIRRRPSYSPERRPHDRGRDRQYSPPFSDYRDGRSPRRLRRHSPPTDAGYLDTGSPTRRERPRRRSPPDDGYRDTGSPTRRERPRRHSPPDDGYRDTGSPTRRERPRRRSPPDDGYRDTGSPRRRDRSRRRSPIDERDRRAGYDYQPRSSRRSPLPRRFYEEDDGGPTPHIITVPVPSRRTPRSPRTVLSPSSSDEFDAGHPPHVIPMSSLPSHGPPVIYRPHSRASLEREPTIIGLAPGQHVPESELEHEPGAGPVHPVPYHPGAPIREHGEEPVTPGERRAIIPTRRAPTAFEEDRRRDRFASPSPSPPRRRRRLPRSRSPSIRSIVHRVPEPRSPGAPADLSYDDAERDRYERFHDLEGQLIRAAQTATEGEDQREAEFRRNEEERQHLFLEHEDRREEESRIRREQIWQDLENRLSGVPPVITVVEPSQPETESLIGSVRQVAQDATSRYAADILETVKAEREELAREREAADAERNRILAEAEAERNRIAQEREDRIRALEEELARVRTELENEKQIRITEEAETRERERQEIQERDEAIREQSADITNLVQDQRDLCARKKEIMDERWEEKQGRREDKDSKLAEIRETVAKILQDQEAERLRAEEERAATQDRPGTERIIEELQRQNAELRELLNSLAESWRADCARQHEETLNAVRATAQEQVPFNVQGYLDEFCKALSSEVKVLLSEVGKLREERRALQYEIGCLLCMKSKFGPGGEFEPDWRPPPGAPGGPPADGPPEPPMPPEEPPPAKPAWRTVHQRTARKQKLKKEPPQPPAPGPTTAPDPRRQVTSWATWQPDPGLVPTPPSVEPTLLVPDRGSPGLFGPRSPRDSYHRG